MKRLQENVIEQTYRYFFWNEFCTVLYYNTTKVKHFLPHAKEKHTHRQKITDFNVKHSIPRKPCVI